LISCQIGRVAHSYRFGMISNEMAAYSKPSDDEKNAARLQMIVGRKGPTPRRGWNPSPMLQGFEPRLVSNLLVILRSELLVIYIRH